MAETLRNGDRVVDVDAGRSACAARHASADIVYGATASSLCGSSWPSWPLGAHFVDAGAIHGAGVGAKLEVGMGVLVVVLVMEARPSATPSSERIRQLCCICLSERLSEQQALLANRDSALAAKEGMSSLLRLIFSRYYYSSSFLPNIMWSCIRFPRSERCGSALSRRSSSCSRVCQTLSYG